MGDVLTEAEEDVAAWLERQGGNGGWKRFKQAAALVRRLAARVEECETALRDAAELLRKPKNPHTRAENALAVLDAATSAPEAPLCGHLDGKAQWCGKPMPCTEHPTETRRCIEVVGATVQTRAPAPEAKGAAHTDGSPCNCPRAPDAPKEEG